MIRVSTNRPSQPIFVTGDLDGFFGLAIDNLIQFLLILGMGSSVLGFPVSLMLQTVLPGAALSVLIGNFYYSYQSQKLSRSTGRTDVTALPYGINTVSLFAFIFLVMLPVKLEAEASGMSPSQAAMAAWRTGLAACFFSGIIELLGSSVAERIRRATPRAALLSTLAGIAISFIAIDFAIRTFRMPLVALLPLSVILATYFSGIKMPARIPGGAWAVGLGTISAWVLTAFPGVDTPVSYETLRQSIGKLSFYAPIPVIGDLVAGLQHELTMKFLVPVILPMGLFNVLGSLQNIESAEAAGDRYSTAPCLAVNGLGSLAASFFGSCFPTTIYIGHPGWKGLGARSGYSILNGVFFSIMALFGLTYLVSALVPIEAGMAIVLWIGIVITAQAFEATPTRHAPAVALGLFPAIAAWGTLILTQTLGAANFDSGNSALAEQVLQNPQAFSSAGLQIEGLLALSQGFMLTCLIWSAVGACLIERKFNRATVWMLVGALAAFFGFIHAGHLSPSGGVYHIGWATGWRWSLGYLLSAAFFGMLGIWARRTKETN
ncbi:MAG: NCS2 family permease [Deltaproteobacteria bacterium]|nr:NCS2 family permease [Deltaproteobacteria bacterium]